MCVQTEQGRDGHAEEAERDIVPILARTFRPLFFPISPETLATLQGPLTCTTQHATRNTHQSPIQVPLLHNLPEGQHMVAVAIFKSTRALHAPHARNANRYVVLPRACIMQT